MSDFSKLRANVERKFNNVLFDGREYAVNAIPTGSLDLDYALGTGGWTVGHFTGIYGPRDIGKSSILGLAAVVSAQKLGLNSVMIFVEGQFDAGWARSLGVEYPSDNLIVLEPNSGEEAFELLYESVTSGADFVLFDSVGALQGEREMTQEGVKQVGGQSGMITHWMKKCEPPIRKNGVCVLMLNQVRDVMNSRFPMKEQPGGNALEHYESVIVQLKRSQEKYIHPDEKGVVMGERIQCVIERSKKRGGRGQVALIDFYSMDVEGYPFGIDKAFDTISIGKRTGVIEQAGAYYTLPDGSRHQGQKNLITYLDENPTVYEQVRQGVLEAMVADGGKLEVVA